LVWLIDRLTRLGDFCHLGHDFFQEFFFEKFTSIQTELLTLSKEKVLSYVHLTDYGLAILAIIFQKNIVSGLTYMYFIRYGIYLLTYFLRMIVTYFQYVDNINVRS
jgi:hypothetical protein